MSDATPEALVDDGPDPFVLRAERRLRLLKELSEIGMELARGLKDQAQAEVSDGEADAPRRRDPANAFARLSRAIRLTLTLEAKTDLELRDLKAGLIPAREEARSRAEKERIAGIAANFDERHDQVFNLVFAVAKAEIDDNEAFGEVFEALRERLDVDDGYRDVCERPLREIVERLCRDLELSPDWSQWQDDGWAPEYSPDRFRFSPFNQPSRRPLLSPESKSLVPWEQVRAHALE